MSSVSEDWKNGGYAYYPKYRFCGVCDHQTPARGMRLLPGHIPVCPRHAPPAPEPIQGPPRPSGIYRRICGECRNLFPRSDMWKPGGYKSGKPWVCHSCTPKPPKRVTNRRKQAVYRCDPLIIEYLRKNGKSTYHQIAAALDMSISGTRHALLLLVLDGTVQRRIGDRKTVGRGQEPTTFWLGGA